MAGQSLNQTMGLYGEATHTDAVATPMGGGGIIDSLMQQIGVQSGRGAAEADQKALADALSNASSGPRLDQPLIVIGVGGSGRRIATDMKAAMIDRFGQIPTNAQLLAFDSGSEVISTTDRLGRVVKLQTDSEFLTLGPVPVMSMKRMPHYHTEIAERLGEGLYQMKRPSITHGAGQERTQGVTVAMYHISMIVREIRRALNHVTERTLDLFVDRDNVPGINIVLAGSTGGGQGSGALLDIALLVREELMAMGEWADVSRMVGLLVLPSAFGNLGKRPQKNLIPNTFAFLQELNMLMRGERIRLEYPGNLSVTSTEPPFEHVYVVDGIDENGHTWPSLGEVCTAAARSLVLLYCSDVGREEVAYAINNESVLNQVSPDGYGTFLGSLGLAEIFYPARQVAQICTLRYGRAVIAAMLNGNVTSVDANRSVGNRAEAQRGGGQTPEAGVRSPNIQLSQLTAHIQNHEMAQRAQLIMPSDIEDKEPAQMLARVRAFANQYAQQRIYKGSFSQMQQQSNKLTAELTEQCERWLTALDEGGDMPMLQSGLGQHLARLYDLQQVLQHMQSEADEAVTHQKRAAESAERHVEEASESFPIGRANRTLSACHQYLDVWSDLMRAESRQRALTLTAQVVHQLAGWAEEKSQLAQATAQRLQQAADWLARCEQQLSRRSSDRNVINLADPMLIKMLYSQHAGVPNASVNQVILSRGGMTTWNNATPDTLIRGVLNEVYPLFVPLTEITVEDILQQRWPNRSVEDWMGMLEEMAAGAWNLERAKLPPGNDQLASFLTIGVPDASDTLFASGANTCTSTNDPERIVVLRTVYGAPIDALKAAPRWRQIYDSVVNEIEPPLHIFPGFQQSVGESVQTFTLGLIFDFIYQKGSFFYSRHEDLIEDDIRLGQGLENALAGMKVQERLVGRLAERIDAHIAEIGKNQAADQIDAYVAKGTERDDELSKDLLRTARDYAAALR